MIQESSLPYPNIYLGDDGVYKVNGKGEEEKIAKEMFIEEVGINIDTHETFATIVYQNLFEQQRQVVRRDKYLNPKELMKMQSVGLDVMSSSAKDLTYHFRNQEQNASRVNYHTKLGYGEYNEKIIFKLSSCVGLNSTYHGDLSLLPQGNLKEYIGFLKEQVIPYRNLTFVFVAALSSLLLGLIGEELGLGSSVIHLKANSTTGKTTAIRLGISIFGYPDTNKPSLLKTYNATGNALIKQLVGLRGVTVAFDEISMSSTTNFTKFIYQLANGTDKDRLNKDSELKQQETWLGVILSTGEKSLVNSANKNVGVQIRVIELQDFVFTESAEHAELINEHVLKNNGVFALPFAEYLLNQEKEGIIKEYEISRKEIKECFIKNNVVDSFTNRRVKHFSIIYTTAKYLKKFVGLPINLETLKELIVEIERPSMRSRNYSKVAIKCLAHYYTSNINKFKVINSSETDEIVDTENSYIGKAYYNKHREYIELEFTPEFFKKAIEESGFEDMGVVLKELKANGWLVHEKDRNTRERRSLSGIKMNMYVVKIPREFGNIER